MSKPNGIQELHVFCENHNPSCETHSFILIATPRVGSLDFASSAFEEKKEGDAVL